MSSKTSNTELYVWNLKVLTVDSSAMTGLKERYDSCDELLGASPLLLLSISNLPQKPLTLTLTNPSGGSKKPKSGSRTTSLPQPGITTAATTGSKLTQPFGYSQGMTRVTSPHITYSSFVANLSILTNASFDFSKNRQFSVVTQGNARSPKVSFWALLV